MRLIQLQRDGEGGGRLGDETDRRSCCCIKFAFPFPVPPFCRVCIVAAVTSPPVSLEIEMRSWRRSPCCERASQEGEEQSADPQREGTLRDSRSPTFFYIRAEPRTWLHLVL